MHRRDTFLAAERQRLSRREPMPAGVHPEQALQRGSAALLQDIPVLPGTVGPTAVPRRQNAQLFAHVCCRRRPFGATPAQGDAAWESRLRSELKALGLGTADLVVRFRRGGEGGVSAATIASSAAAARSALTSGKQPPSSHSMNGSIIPRPHSLQLQ